MNNLPARCKFLGVLLLACSCVALVACDGGATRNTSSEALTLIMAFLENQSQAQKLDFTADFEIKELTTDEIWRNFKVQLFEVSGGGLMQEAFLLHDAQVMPVGMGINGKGIQQTLQHPLGAANDAALWMVFTHHTASGDFDLVAVYAPSSKANGLIFSTFGYQGNLRLHVTDQKDLILLADAEEIARPCADNTLGRIKTINTGVYTALSLAAYDDLPYALMSRLIFFQ